MVGDPVGDDLRVATLQGDGLLLRLQGSEGNKWQVFLPSSPTPTSFWKCVATSAHTVEGGVSVTHKLMADR